MSDETSDKAAIERKIRRAALFGMMYGQIRPDPVNPLSPHRAPTEAEAQGLSEEIDGWRAAAKQFVASSTPLELGTRRGPNLQNRPVWRRNFPVWPNMATAGSELWEKIVAADLPSNPSLAPRLSRAETEKLMADRGAYFPNLVNFCTPPEVKPNNKKSEGHKND